MEFKEYVEFTDETAIYEESALSMLASLTQNQVLAYVCLSYPITKLNGEAGELAEEIGKVMRDDKGTITIDRKARMRKELGDVMYYIARIARELDVSLDDIAAENMSKLRSRKDRGVITGLGSDR